MNIQVHRLDPNVPDPVESRRSPAGRIVRFVYAIGVLGVIGFFGLRFGAPLVLLDGSGVVWAPSKIVSLPYMVQVERMEVEPGARVQAGAPIAIVHSPQVNEILSALMRAMTDLTGREAELHVKARIARDSIEAARSRLRVSEDALRRLEAAKDQSSTSLVYRTEVYREQAQAVQNVVALEAEAAESSAQLTRLADQRQKLQSQMDQIERHFDGGRVRSPTAGIVSARLSRPGETVVAGSSIAEIYEASDMSVLWYIPNFRLVDPKIGQHAFVVLGKTRLRGTIEEILPISSAFAGRKNSILQGAEATQVARIRLDPGTKPPALDSVVHVHMYYTEAADRFFRAAVRFLRLD